MSDGDSPARSERFGVFPTLGARLDDLDTRVRGGELPEGATDEASALSVVVDAPLVVATHDDLDSAGLAAYIDGDAGYIKDTSGRLWSAGFKASEESGFVPVSESNPAEFAYDEAETIEISDLPASWLGSGGPIVDFGDGTGMMVLHIEGEKWQYLAAGKVVMDADGPVSVTYLGPIINPKKTQGASIGDDLTSYAGSGTFLETVSGQIRLYFVEWPTGAQEPEVSMAQCSRADIETAVGSDEAPAFLKWDGEDFTRNGLTGVGESIGNVAPRGVGGLLRLPDGKWVLVDADTGNDLWWWRVAISDDEGLTWTAVANFAEQGSDEWYTATIYSGDPDNPVHMTDPVAWVYTTVADPSNRWNTNRIGRAVVRLFATVSNASRLRYDLDEASDWSSAPRDVAAALDELASRLTAVES